MGAYKKVLIVLLIILLIALTAGYFLLFKQKPISAPLGPPVNITYSNIEEQFSQNQMITELPESSSILIQFYNFNTGEREIERMYLLKKSDVKEVSSADQYSDIIISLNSKYLSKLTDQNLCQVVQEARNNGDMSTETDLSTTSLLWKFKSMTEYRDCLGF